MQHPEVTANSPPDWLQDSVSRETLERLSFLQEAVVKWNPKINLVSKRSLDDMWDRHISDSAQLFALRENADEWVDLGSGGGFPGLVIAIMAKEAKEPFKVTLVESDTRKCVFLRKVAVDLDLDVSVVRQRIETLTDRRFDVISARALASLSKLLSLSAPILTQSGSCLFMKGVSWREELTQAAADWHMKWEAIPSLTNSDSVILTIQELHRVGE